MAEYFVTTSWDGGTPENLKVAELLTKYKLKGTFYIPLKSEYPLLKHAQTRALSKDFEIGGFTIHGYALTKIPFQEAQIEIEEGKKRFEKILGKSITSFAYPNGAYTHDLAQYVGLCGFTYARTTSSFQTRVSQIMSDGVTLQAQDQHFFAQILSQAARRGRYLGFTSSWDVCAREYLELIKTEGGVFHLCGNALTLEKNNDWERLESVLEYISKRTSRSSRITNSKIPAKLVSKKFSLEVHKSLDGYVQKYEQENKGDEVVVAEIAKTFVSSAKVLDVEAGTGRFAPYFKAKAYKGIESCKELCSYAKAKYWGYSFEHTTLSAFLKTKKAKYDLILMWDVCRLTPHPYVLIKKNSRTQSACKEWFTSRSASQTSWITCKTCTTSYHRFIYRPTSS